MYYTLLFLVPDIVWNINSLTAEETKQLSHSLDSSEEDRWWEYVDLTKLVLASNTLKFISPEISNYPALTVLDVCYTILIRIFINIHLLIKKLICIY